VLPPAPVVVVATVVDPADPVVLVVDPAPPAPPVVVTPLVVTPVAVDGPPVVVPATVELVVDCGFVVESSPEQAAIVKRRMLGPRA
jgi:hypothetical protein